MTEPSTIDATRPAATPGPLRLGPLIRHIGPHDATIWVETTRPGCVEVRAGGASVQERTFQVDGHSYAILVVDGLAVGSNTPYQVLFDGELVWPVAGSPYPPSLIRTIDPARPLRLIFGSCRSPTAVKVHDPTGSGDDVLGAYARRIVGQDPDAWPDALLMLGDQVYADETSPATRAFIASRRDPRQPPYEQVADFEEYTRLYAEAWGDPDTRWLLSVIPSSMMFDDHDVIDDWNTSRLWRREMGATSWWRDRIVGALMSYWIYQHLGNQSATELGANDLLTQVRRSDDAGPLLRSFAAGADREADGGPGVMWSYRRDYGRVRLLMIDSRCGRVLEEDRRQMVGDAEFAWIEAQTEDRDYDHLLVGTSVPWLLPRALHDIEAADERLTAGVRGRTIARIAEHVRRAVDLEHWAAFNESFERLARLFGRLGSPGSDGRAPATICVLSGDVHHTYISETVYPEPTVSRIYQLTCSPMHNSIPLPMRLVFWLSWNRYASGLTRLLSRFGRVPAASIEWRTTVGPFFGNYLAMLRFDGLTATFGLEKSAFDGPVTRSTPVAEARLDLTSGRLAEA
jgi:PhoD-like phosphatase